MRLKRGRADRAAPVWRGGNPPGRRRVPAGPAVREGPLKVGKEGRRVGGRPVPLVPGARGAATRGSAADHQAGGPSVLARRFLGVVVAHWAASAPTRGAPSSRCSRKDDADRGEACRAGTNQWLLGSRSPSAVPSLRGLRSRSPSPRSRLPMMAPAGCRSRANALASGPQGPSLGLCRSASSRRALLSRTGPGRRGMSFKATCARGRPPRPFNWAGQERTLHSVRRGAVDRSGGTCEKDRAGHGRSGRSEWTARGNSTPWGLPGGPSIVSERRTRPLILPSGGRALRPCARRCARTPRTLHRPWTPTLAGGRGLRR